MLRLVNAREHYDRYLPRSLLLIFSKNRHPFGLTIEQPLALLAKCGCRQPLHHGRIRLMPLFLCYPKQIHKGLPARRT
jgi:hypothetical protein